MAMKNFFSILLFLVLILDQTSPSESGSMLLLGVSGGGGGTPTLIIDEQFTTGTYFPGPIASDLVDTRASSKFVTNASGVLSSVASNVLPISNAGMLVEGAATNIVWSSNPSTAGGSNPWNTFQGQLVTGQAAPDGTTNASYLSDFGSGGSVYINGQFGTDALPGNIPIIFYCYIKIATGGAGHGQLFIENQGTTSGFTLNYDMGTGLTSSPTTVGTGVYTSSGMISVGSWWILWASGQLTNSATSTTGKAGFNFNATDLYAWGCNLIENAIAVSSNVQTPGNASATRAADSIAVQYTGIGRIVFTFDDNSTQTISGINPATNYTIPTTLNRPLIKRMQGYSF